MEMLEKAKKSEQTTTNKQAEALKKAGEKRSALPTATSSQDVDTKRPKSSAEDKSSDNQQQETQTKKKKPNPTKKKNNEAAKAAKKSAKKKGKKITSNNGQVSTCQSFDFVYVFGVDGATTTIQKFQSCIPLLIPS